MDRRKFRKMVRVVAVESKRQSKEPKEETEGPDNSFPSI